MSNSILRLPEVKNRTGLGRSTIYNLVSDGTFPKPVNLGSRSIGWVEDEVDTWIENRISESRNNSAS